MTSVLVVGAGAIGLCCAYYLRRSGHDVTVVDPAPLAAKASGHNAGWVIPSMSTPVPAPGMLLQAMRWVLRRDSPLYLSPSVSPSFVMFMVRMLASCTEAQFRRGSATLTDLSRDALDLFDDLSASGVEFETHSDPLTMLFTDAHKVDARLRELELLEGRLPGFSWRQLDRVELAAHSPHLNHSVVAGIQSSGDRAVDPGSLVRGLAAACKRDGVVLRIGSPAALEDDAHGRTWARVEGKTVHADRIVVAAGAWTNDVLEGIGERVALQSGKGYGYDLPISVNGPTAPMYLAEAKVAITPLDTGVRVAGTMGFGPADETIGRFRAAGILKGLQKYFTDWPGPAGAADPWVGLRPMTPDGVPLIGPLHRHPRVLVATGHAMLGISLAPVTGRMIAELVSGATRPDAIQALHPERFSRSIARNTAIHERGAR